VKLVVYVRKKWCYEYEEAKLRMARARENEEWGMKMGKE